MASLSARRPAYPTLRRLLLLLVPVLGMIPAACLFERSPRVAGCEDRPGIIQFERESPADSVLILRVSRGPTDSVQVVVRKEERAIPDSAFRKFMGVPVDVSLKGAHELTGRNVILGNGPLVGFTLLATPNDSTYAPRFANGRNVDSTESWTIFPLRDSLGRLYGILENQNYWCI